MWKDSYVLGDTLIDTQHKELFKRVEKLLGIVEREDAGKRKQECIDAILFLKNYALEHFEAEEKFQESLGYTYLDVHRVIHESFVKSVLEAEKTLVDSDFALPAIKEFCGFLSMWLIYHVAGADQKIIKNEAVTVAEVAVVVSYQDCIVESMNNVLSTMLGDAIEIQSSAEKIKEVGDISVKVVVDEVTHHVVAFGFTQKTALGIINDITSMSLDKMDELAYAALLQIVKTICDNAAMNIASNLGSRDKALAAKNKEGFIMQTPYGYVSVSFEG